MPASFSSDSYQPEGLIAGNAHLLTAKPVTVLSGQNLKRGDVVGLDGDGKALLSLAAASDGSETPDFIMAEDCDASAADVAGVAYQRGDFIESGINLGTGHTADSVREGLRVKGILLIKGA